MNKKNNTVTFKALKENHYGNRNNKKGDIFEVEISHIKIVQHLGWGVPFKEDKQDKDKKTEKELNSIELQEKEHKKDIDLTEELSDNENSSSDIKLTEDMKPNKKRGRKKKYLTREME